MNALPQPYPKHWKDPEVLTMDNTKRNSCITSGVNIGGAYYRL